MGNPRSQKNKPHKSRFSTKSSRNIHKSGTVGNGARRKQSGQPLQNARAARLHHNKIAREQKRIALLSEKRMGCALKSPPLVLALIAVSQKANLAKAKKQLLEQIYKSANKPDGSMDVEECYSQENTDGDLFPHVCPRHKMRLMVIEACQEDLQKCLAVAKVADVIAVVTSVSEQDGFVDKKGKLCLSMLRALGLPSVFGLMMDFGDIPAKKRLETKKDCNSTLEVELPEGSKVFSVDVPEDYEQVLRYLSNHRLSSPLWRNQRPFVMAEKIEFVPDVEMLERGTLLLSGYVRGRSLSVNQLVHLTGLGDFTLQQIEILEDPCSWQARKSNRVDLMQTEDSMGAEVLHPDPQFQEPLIIENTPDSLAGEQTWPTKEELAKAKDENRRRKKKVLPKGTSEYQAAWFVEDSDGNESNASSSEDEPMEGVDLNDKNEDSGVVSEEENQDQEDLLADASFHDEDYDSRSEMMVDEEMTTEERMAELERLKAAYAADEEFPDEVDTPLDKPARERFVKYRGLKSFRTSAWDAKESLPPEYGKIFSFENFRRALKLALAKASDVDEGRVPGSIGVGSYVKLFIKDIPLKSAASLENSYKQMPLVACGLFQHESKMSVLHFSVKKHETFLEPLKSKESFIFHTGFRVYKANPVFSTDDINMDKHKLERFLHPGRFSVASVFAPISFPPLPLIVFKENIQATENALFVASGSLKSVDPDRIILKKIVLSGYPQRVHKQKAVVRFMFHNPEDVRWYKPLELWTKYGRRGRIKEPVGTHGAMKCIFDGVLQQRDAVCVSLYKRVYPKWPAATS